MLKTLYPVSFRRYSSLAILGPIADGFSTWLLEHRYSIRTEGGKFGCCLMSNQS